MAEIVRLVQTDEQPAEMVPNFLWHNGQIQPARIAISTQVRAADRAPVLTTVNAHNRETVKQQSPGAPPRRRTLGPTPKRCKGPQRGPTTWMAISRGQCPAYRGPIPCYACSIPKGLVSSRSLQTQGAPRARQPWALLSNAFSVSKSLAGGLLHLVLWRLESIEKKP